MILAAAQTTPKQGNIEANLKDHYHFIKLAAKNGAELISFPELSITSYDRENAAKLAFTPEDFRLTKLQSLSKENKIVVIAGAPIKIESNLYIGSFIIKPDNSIEIYTKQFLHDGEELYFQSSFDYNPQLIIADTKISLAICADIDHPNHPENACNLGSSFYLPSIFFSKNGISEAYSKLSGFAKKHSLSVLMANFGGTTWNTEAAGKSAFWNNNGELVASINHDSSGLLIIDVLKNEWKVIDD